MSSLASSSNILGSNKSTILPSLLVLMEKTSASKGAKSVVLMEAAPLWRQIHHVVGSTTYIGVLRLGHSGVGLQLGDASGGVSYTDQVRASACSVG